MRFSEEKLRDLRIMRNYSQDELAEKAGIKDNTVSEYENGTTLPSTEALIDIANALNVSMDWFYVKD